MKEDNYNNETACYIIGNGSLPIICGEILASHNIAIFGIISDDPLVQKWASKNDLQIISPLDDLYFLLCRQPYHFLFSINNPYILSEKLYTTPIKYTINYHDSLLPRYAGSNATSWVIINREKKHGITWHLVNSIINGGDVLIQSEITIEDRETAFSLNTKCFGLAIEKFKELIEKLLRKDETLMRQNLNQRTHFPNYKRLISANVINWKHSAQDIDATIRALEFNEYSNILGLVKLRIDNDFVIVKDSRVIDSSNNIAPGTITKLHKSCLRIKCSNGELEIRNLMNMEGQELSISDLVKTYNLKQNHKLIILDRDSDQFLTEYHNDICKNEKYWVDKFIHFDPIQNPYSNLGNSYNKTIDKRNTKILFTRELLKFNTLPIINNDLTNYIITGIICFLARISSIYFFDIAYAEKRKSSSEIDEFKSLFSEFVPLRARLKSNESFIDSYLSLSNELQTIKNNKTYNNDIFFRYPELSYLKNVIVNKNLFPIKLICSLP